MKLVNKLSTESVDNSLSGIENELYEKSIEETFDFYFSEKEASIQAELYHQCKLRDIECHLEVNISKRSFTYGGRRVDAVIKVMGRYYLIECKLKIANDKLTNIQIQRYLKLGYPVFMIDNADQIVPMLVALMSDLKFYNKAYVYQKLCKRFIVMD